MKTHKTVTRPTAARPTALAAALGALVLAGSVAALLLQPAPAAAQPDGFRAERAEVDLGADRTAYLPGEPVRLAARLIIEPGWHVNAHRPTYDYLIPTTVELELPAGWAAAEVDYPEPVQESFAFADEPLAVYQGTVTAIARLAVPDDAAPGLHPVRARVRYQACDDRSCLPPVTAELAVDLTVGEGGEPANLALFAPPESGDEASPAAAPAREGAPPAAPSDRRGLGWMLGLALVGGLILNAMPCVLPVLSLKVFGLVQSAGRGRADVVVGALATSAGIVVSFVGLAAAAVVARAAGAAVGWGVQFQRPGFVAFLAVVVVLFCLNLWGLFEIPLPSRLANALGSRGPHEGVPGHFASGLFATLMATPCSAPFLGTAVGFALAQPSGSIFAIFTAVGVGMALPYLLLAAAPGAARLLPRPGPWMDTLKQVMGFLLAAAAVWLFYVLSAQLSAERLAAIELALVALALFVWLRARAARGPAARRIAMAGVAAAVAATLAIAIGAGTAAGRPAAGGGGEGAGGKIAWVEFDRAHAEQIAASGGLVFVDVTADWCFTCKANERLVIETEEVARLFADHGVVPMKADWTNRDDEIAAYLGEYGRYAIPFYLLYRPRQQPHLFGELLTKGEIADTVRDAAAQVAERR
jgi:suppressor for copper-sensitivity B